MFRRPLYASLPRRTAYSIGKYQIRGYPCRAASTTTGGDEKLSYTERQKRTGRPISPHVSIYAFPVGALSSITTRITGAVLTAGVAGVGVAALGGADVAGFMTIIGNSFVGPVAKIVITFPLVYHYLSGFRHYLWDKYPNLLHNEAVARDSKLLYGAAGVLSLGAAFVKLDPRDSSEDREKLDKVAKQ